MEDNVVGFPAVVTADCPWVRIVSCNPLELPDPELPPVFSGYPTGDRSGWDEFREEYRRVHARPARGLQRVHAGARLPAAARARVHPPLAVPEPVPVSGGGRLRALAPARADVGAARLVRAQGGPRGVRGAAGRRAARVPEPRQPRLGGRGADAAAGGPARRGRLPRDRQQGAAARPDRAARRAGGRRAGAAARAAAARGRGDHARRQQHRHRVPPLRQADGAAAAVLGPVRQRPADGRARASASGCRRSSSRTRELGEAIERLIGRRGARRAARARSASGSRTNPGTERAADCIESVRTAEPRARDRA